MRVGEKNMVGKATKVHKRLHRCQEWPCVSSAFLRLGDVMNGRTGVYKAMEGVFHLWISAVTTAPFDMSAMW